MFCVKSKGKGKSVVLQSGIKGKGKGKGKSVVIQSGIKSKLISQLHNFYLADHWNSPTLTNWVFFIMAEHELLLTY